jgi:hypothetical protein
MTSFASAQWAYDNAEDPRYFGPDADDGEAEEEAKEQWFTVNSITEIVDIETIDFILDEICANRLEEAQAYLYGAIEEAWEKRWESIRHARRYGREP